MSGSAARARAAGEESAGKFNNKAMTYYGRWTYKYEQAAKLDEPGVVLIAHSVEDALGAPMWRSTRPTTSPTFAGGA